MGVALARLREVGRRQAPHVRFDPGGPHFDFAFPSGERIRVWPNPNQATEVALKPAETVYLDIEPNDNWGPPHDLEPHWWHPEAHNWRPEPGTPFRKVFDRAIDAPLTEERQAMLKEGRRWQEFEANERLLKAGGK